MNNMDNTPIVEGFRIFFYKSFELLLPALGFSTLVVLIVGILMAATQIQEQSLSFAFKMISLGIVFWIFGPWMFDELILLVSDHIDRIPELLD